MSDAPTNLDPEMDGEMARAALDAIIDRAKKSPLVCECWDCTNCGHEAFMFHPMDEVVACAKCGHRRASKVWLYRFASAQAADSK